MIPRAAPYALLLIVALLAVPASASADPATDAQHADAVDFNRDVRPILSQYCFKCHGIDDKSRKAKLRLDLREAAVGKGGDDAAIVPGKPDDSAIIYRIFTDDEDDLMPPPSMKNPLSAAQKQILRKWVAQGATYDTHWAFEPPRQAPQPPVKQADWVRNPVDAFVLSRLEQAGLTPSPEADRYTLVRRVYLDLIGLPPTPEEADAFVNDKSPDAYEKLVDRLLAMPQYGERWARRWLDLARYADTNGYEKDRPRSIWPYRDWVIKAINDDMPFDQFTIEQLAGDMLPNATVDQKIATGFHRNTMRNEEGGIDPLEFRFYSLVDRVGTTGTTWLGMTIACAQCHTHKYDPIVHREYYQMMAFFDDADEPELKLESPETAAKREDIEAKMEQLTLDLPNQWPVGGGVEWQVASADITRTQTTSEVRLESIADGELKAAWRAVGPVAQRDTYTFEIESTATGVDRIRIEALADGGTGPGRTRHGNFVLSEIVATVTGDDGKPVAVKLERPTATFSQQGFTVADAIDGKPRTGWGIGGAETKTQSAVFHIAKPDSLPKAGKKPAKWTITLTQNYGQAHVLGLLRVSLGAPKPQPEGADQQRRQLVATAYKKWLAERTPSAVEWTVITPTKMDSSTPTLTLQPGGSILGSGDITKSDTYDLTFANLPKGVTAIRIEALPHESLPAGGPGLIYYEGPKGDFCLSELNLSVAGASLKFGRTDHTYAAGNFESAKSIDGNPQTGWMINGQQGKPHYAVFALDKPSEVGGEAKIHMLFERHFAPALGHFRISITTDPKAIDKPAAMPPEIESALLKSAVPGTPSSSSALPETSEKSETKTKSEEPSWSSAFPGVDPVLFREFLLTAKELEPARKEIDKLFKSIPEPPSTLVMTPRPPGRDRTTYIHNRGEFLQPTDPVEPDVPAVLPPMPDGVKHDRLAFARWLVSKENPLTARVTVNRQWQAFFGRGLVRTTEDFGFQGEMPSHPKLLDWMAVQFMNDGWSMKKLHRLIVTSNTYRQSSAATPELLSRDPENVLLARGPRFRVEAEIVRDAALKASGLLSGKMYGQSVFPPQPASVTIEGAYGRLEWKTSTGEDRYRRSLYTYSKRTAPYAMFGTFDAPSGEACVPRRELSNTPLQALTVLNDEVFVEAAQALGKLATTEVTGDDAAKATFVFRRALTRPPTKAEVALLIEFAAEQRERFAKNDLDPAKFAGVKEEAVETATWTAVARAVMNLDEAVTKD